MMMTPSARSCTSRTSRFAGLARSIPAVSCLALVIATLSPIGAHAESISGALAKAYSFSPDLNQQRAATRATDENVPAATAGFRPTVGVSAQAGVTRTEVEQRGQSGALNTLPRSASLSISQTIYNGNRTTNNVRRAESQVMQSRETLRLGEQSILGSAAQAYMNVLRDTALLKLQQNNVEVLRQQLKQTQDRFQVGEVTRTDVAQAEAALAQGQANSFSAQSQLQSSLAIYRQLIGVPPHNLEPARPLEGLLPKSLQLAVAMSQSEHPSIQAALHAVDAAALAVKVQEGALYPTVSLQGSLSSSRDASSSQAGVGVTTATALANLTVPIYDGGLSYAAIRQAKETLGQQRLVADQQREAVRASVVSAWGAYQNTKFVIQSYESQVRANEIALNGVREEAKVGQRTTLDVLNAQQVLLNSRVNLIVAQRDRVVNSYLLLSAIGKLSSTTLGLGVTTYDPTIHYDQVKDKWIGVRTPDGR